MTSSMRQAEELVQPLVGSPSLVDGHTTFRNDTNVVGLTKFPHENAVAQDPQKKSVESQTIAASPLTSETITSTTTTTTTESWDCERWFHPDGRPKHTITTDDQSWTANYFRLATEEEGYFPNATKRLEPLALMRDYIRQHGKQTLQQEWDHCQKNSSPHPQGNLARIANSTACAPLAKRTFVMGWYSCPLEAGNRLHKYMNHLLWAIVTGRTFLSAYWDEDACEEEVVPSKTTFCASVVTPQTDCDPILQLNPWVPQFHEWKDILGLPHRAVRADGINPKDKHDPWGRPYDQDGAPRLIRVGLQLLTTPALYLKTEKLRKKLLEKKENQETAGKLLGKGPYFMYGMLFESLFTMQPSTFQDKSLVADPKIYQTWAIHSRHRNKNDDGSTAPEAKCMDALKGKVRPPCIMYVMSDRAKALDKLPRMLLQKYQCVGLYANHTEGKSFSTEHGVFAGLGYFQDLYLARTARHGFVTAHTQQRKGKGIRTSSALMLEAIHFRRILENDPQVPTDLLVCTNPYFSVDYSQKMQLPNR